MMWASGSFTWWITTGTFAGRAIHVRASPARTAISPSAGHNNLAMAVITWRKGRFPRWNTDGFRSPETQELPNQLPRRRVEALAADGSLDRIFDAARSDRRARSPGLQHPIRGRSRSDSTDSIRCRSSTAQRPNSGSFPVSHPQLARQTAKKSCRAVVVPGHDQSGRGNENVIRRVPCSLEVHAGIAGQSAVVARRHLRRCRRRRLGISAGCRRSGHLGEALVRTSACTGRRRRQPRHDMRDTQYR